MLKATAPRKKSPEIAAMDLTAWTGLVAGTLTTAAFVPQVYKTWRSRSAADISLGMFLLFSLGVLLWLLYGIAIDAAPVILANAVTLLLSLTILIMKVRFGRRTAPAQP